MSFFETLATVVLGVWISKAIPRAGVWLLDVLEEIMEEKE